MNEISKRPLIEVVFSSDDAHGAALSLLPSAYVAHDCFDCYLLQ